jgi:isoleucyl-tRNA synthetase
LIAASGQTLSLLERHASGLAEITNVSSVEIVSAEGTTLAEYDRASENVISSGNALLIIDAAVTAEPAGGTKCNRCWRYTGDTADYGIWQGVCARCRSALKEMGIEPPVAAQAEANQ